MAQAVLVQSGERRAVAVVAPRFEAVSRLWVLTGLKHQPPVFSRLPVQQGKGGSSQTASGLCLVRHSTCVRLALLVETNPCFLVQNFLGFWALQKRPVLLAKVQPNKFQSGARRSCRAEEPVFLEFLEEQWCKLSLTLEERRWGQTVCREASSNAFPCIYCVQVWVVGLHGPHWRGQIRIL